MLRTNEFALSWPRKLLRRGRYCNPKTNQEREGLFFQGGLTSCYTGNLSSLPLNAEYEQRRYFDFDSHDLFRDKIMSAGALLRKRRALRRTTCVWDRMHQAQRKGLLRNTHVDHRAFGSPPKNCWEAQHEMNDTWLFRPLAYETASYMR